MLVLGASSAIRSADYYWVGTTNAWSTLSNWRLVSTSGSVPTVLPLSTDNIFITGGTVMPLLPTSALTINALTISSSKSLDLNGIPTFTINGSVNLQSGSIINSSTTLNSIVSINNLDVTFGTSTGNLGFTIGAAAPNDKITLNITTAKFRNYGSLNCYANTNLVYKVNSVTATDNFINELGTNNFRGTFSLTINENTVATSFGESAGSDTFWKTVTINKYTNVDFSIGITNDGYSAIFKDKLTLNGESKVGTNVSNLILGNQCNATFTLNNGLDLLFTKNTNIILGKYSATKQPTINIAAGNLTTLTLPVSYTAGGFEAYKTSVAGTTTLNLSTIGAIILDKTSTFTGATSLTGNNVSINASTFAAATSITTSTAVLKVANTTAVTFAGDVTLSTPQFTTSTLLGGVATTPINFQKNLTITQTTPITAYTNSNVNGFKYAVFNGATGNQVYTSNSLVPFYRLDINKTSGYLQLNSPLFMNYSVDNATDIINVNLTSGKIVGSETNRLIIYRNRYAINGFTNNNYIAAGLVIMSNDATNLPLKKFLPLGSATNYAPIEITCNTGTANFIAVTYFNQNPQLLNSNFTGGALDVSNCEYWKIAELDANLVNLATANLFDLDKLTMFYMNPKCTKISNSNHALGYTYKNGAVYTPWEKLATTYTANSDGTTLTYINGSIGTGGKLLKQQPEILVSFSYQNVLIVNTTDVYGNPCTLSSATDGSYAFTSGLSGTNAGIVKVHPNVNEDVPLFISNTAAESTPYNVLIKVGADGKPYAVRDLSTNDLINSDNHLINNYTVTFRNSEPIPIFEQYVTNLSSDGVTLPSGVTTFTITTPVGITPTKLDVYNGATLLGSTSSTVNPISVAGISATGSYRFVLAVKDQANQAMSITGYFLK